MQWKYSIPEVKVTVSISVSIAHVDDIFTFVTKLGMVIIIFSWSALQNGLVTISEVKRAYKYNQNMTVSIVSSELVILLQPNLVWWQVTINSDGQWKELVAVFRIKVTANIHFKQIKKFMYVGYVLNCWTFCNQTWYGDQLECYIQGQGHMAHSIKIWLFWLYPLNWWSYGSKLCLMVHHH